MKSFIFNTLLLIALFLFYPYYTYAQNKNSYIDDQIILRHLTDSSKPGNIKYIDMFHSALHGCYNVKTSWDAGVFGSGIFVTASLNTSYIDKACFNQGVPCGEWIYRLNWGGGNGYTIQTENFENGYLHGEFKVETTNGDNLSYQTIFNNGTGYYINMCPYIMYAQGQLNKGEKDGIWVQLSLLDLRANNIKIEKYDNGKLIHRKLFIIQKKMDRSSKKVNFSMNRTYKDETIYHMEPDSNGMPRLQGMIYKGKKEGWWIYIDDDFSSVKKILLQQYKNDLPVKKRQMLYLLQENDTI